MARSGATFDCEISRRGAVGGAKRFPTAQLKCLAQPGTESFVIIDDQHCRLMLVAHR